MNEFTRSLLYVALLICVPIATACIKKGIAVAVDAINAQTQNIKVQRLVREIGDAVANAVAAMNQTYVNDLKAAGTFNEAEQKEALMRAVSAALKSMSRDAQDYIKSNFGDTTQYLENRPDRRQPRRRQAGRCPEYAESGLSQRKVSVK